MEQKYKIGNSGAYSPGDLYCPTYLSVTLLAKQNGIINFCSLFMLHIQQYSCSLSYNKLGSYLKVSINFNFTSQCLP